MVISTLKTKIGVVSVQLSVGETQGITVSVFKVKGHPIGYANVVVDSLAWHILYNSIGNHLACPALSHSSVQSGCLYMI